ncbi:MAG: phosphatidate cytidylyltransferase [Cereibacter changlensis]|uniref:Phosphatidate cytidylyltransferase n=2 Tax=Cereibacter changlensis TaxID=402884 RepID=A0A2T4JVS3_9RHOB|nr:phosphatidate cytidylyltransferase [Cereibacter changlensis]PTE22018.1 phosphatidate cytidylyltransferase [Cereibacter changlensis JA139]PZX57292.1 phosphatidate cytidylyltransferase [Cereibacter changlensis]
MSRPPKPKGRWNDLRRRMGSAAIMLAIGGVEIWLGGMTFAILVLILTGVMMWELARMTAPGKVMANIGLGLIATAVLYGVLAYPEPLGLLPLLVPSLAGIAVPRRDKPIYFFYAAGLMLAGFALIELRAGPGTLAILWLIAVVVASDVMGYFAGRSLGGPKFWPRVSPNKTWSGTIAGWLGAAIVGLGFVLLADAGWGLIVLSPFIALAGQLGDIAESWIKRRSEVKDSSSLIPGHGGVLDRFDALTGAVLAVLALSLAWPLPLPEMGN